MTQIPENIILFGDDHWFHLLPLTFTRPIGELRTGILTIREKWAYELHANISYITQDYLSEKYPLRIEKNNLLINSSFLPDQILLSYISQLKQNQAIFWKEELIAANVPGEEILELGINKSAWDNLSGTDISSIQHISPLRVTRPQHLFQHNGIEITKDFRRITNRKSSQTFSETNIVFGKHPAFLEEGGVIEACTINTEDGPVYIGKHAQIMEGSHLRGPLAICDHAVVKMGAKLYSSTTIGPYCKAGGEINNAILLANSNKGHDGYLGNSVIGEWCNLGADTNASNLKNDYSEVRLWSYVEKKFVQTGLTFCGLIMGDHSKTAINTMLNTGTSIGIACNLYGSGFPRNYIPSFSKGGASGFQKTALSESLTMAERMMARRQIHLDDLEADILKHIYLNHDSITP
jgi:UDP-N-acetylglucosamine diphosphorylase/glucosamine-1-phosphate N-acetyltransferase